MSVQDVWIDMFVPYKEEVYIETELADEIYEAICNSDQCPLSSIEGDKTAWWIELSHNEDDNNENLQYDFFVQFQEFSKKYPEVLFRVDTRDNTWSEDMRTYFLNGEGDNVGVTVIYGKSKWQGE